MLYWLPARSSGAFVSFTLAKADLCVRISMLFCDLLWRVLHARSGEFASFILADADSYDPQHSAFGLATF